jgi:lipopolysaccharide transport system ATP-binding protein
MSQAVVTVKGLGKCYPINEAARPSGGLLATLKRVLKPGAAGGADNRHWALQDISFTVQRGDRVGIIGSNGAGKSTLLKIMSRVAYPTVGEIRISGSLTSLLEVGTGFNENLSGRENVYLNASLHGMHRAEIDRKFQDIVQFSEIGRFIDTPIKHYSSGMRMRLAFSVAAHLDPDILLLDEVLAVGDMSFQRKCLERVDELTNGGRTLFFVSHSMDSIVRYCNRCIWLDSGRIKADGDVQEVVSAYVENVLKVRSEIAVSGNGQGAGHGVVAAGECATETNNDQLSGSATLLKAKVVDAFGKKKSIFSCNEKIGVDFAYEVSGEGVFLPAIHLYCPQGTLLFAATVPETELGLFRKVGGHLVRCTVWLPQSLFNIGTYSISLIVFSPVEAPFKRYFSHEQALSFHCVEAPIGERSARGLMPRGFPGPVRPMLDWVLHEEKID